MSSSIEKTGPEIIVFPCSDDIGRAQIAVAWFRMLADPAKARAVLAQPRVAPGILPEVVAALHESGLTLTPTSMHARVLTPELLAEADLVVTMGGTFARKLLETATTIRREHWLIPSGGAGGDLDRARTLRDLIRSRVAMLVFTEGWGRADLSRETARVTRSRRTSQAFAAF